MKRLLLIVLLLAASANVSHDLTYAQEASPTPIYADGGPNKAVTQCTVMRDYVYINYIASPSVADAAYSWFAGVVADYPGWTKAADPDETWGRHPMPTYICEVTDAAQDYYLDVMYEPSYWGVGVMDYETSHDAAAVTATVTAMQRVTTMRQVQLAESLCQGWIKSGHPVLWYPHDPGSDKPGGNAP
jgi:hypothetical protein